VIDNILLLPVSLIEKSLPEELANPRTAFCAPVPIFND
jgi:hypothetical protein